MKFNSIIKWYSADGGYFDESPLDDGMFVGGKVEVYDENADPTFDAPEYVVEK